VNGSEPKTAENNQEWTKKDNLAKSLIHDALSTDFRSFFDWHKSSKANFDALKTLIEDKSQAAIRNQRKALESMKMEIKMDINAFYNKWHSQYVALMDAGGKLSELEQIELFLGSIPSSKYLAIKAQFDLSEMITTPNGEKTANPLKMTYLLERIKMFDLVSHGHANTDETFFTKQKQKQQKQDDLKEKSFNPKLICFNCGGYGHKPNQCGSPKRPKDFCPDHLHAIMAERKKKQKTFKTSDPSYNDTSKVTSFEDTTFHTVEQKISFDSNCLNNNFKKCYSFFNDEMHTTILDSGSNVNLLTDITYFVNTKFTKYNHPRSLTTYKGGVTDQDGDIHGEGEAIIYVKLNSKITRLVLERALFAPKSPLNIISEGYLQKYLNIFCSNTKKGKELTFNNQKITIAIFSGNLLYYLNLYQPNDKSYFTKSTKAITMNKLHKRLGHIGKIRIQNLLKHNAVQCQNIQFDTNDLETFHSCEACILAKSKMLPHNYATDKRKYDLLEMVVLDYKGPMKHASLKGDTLGYLVFVDLSSSYSFVFPIKSRTETLEKFKIFESFAERSTGKKIKCIRSDGAQEYKYGDFADYLFSKGIKQEFSPAYAHSSNGNAESRIRILGTMPRSMLINANLPNPFTHLAIMCANYIYNRVICKHTHQVTPYEIFHSKKPRIDYFRVFGCKAYYHIHKEQRKTDYNLRSKIGRMVGYSENSNTYKIWNGRKIIETKDVLFDEDSYQFTYSDHVPNEIESSQKEIEDTEHDSIYINVPYATANIPTTSAISTVRNISTPGQTVPGEQSSSFTGVPVHTLLNDSNIENIDIRQLPFYFANIPDEEPTSSSNIHTSTTPETTTETLNLLEIEKCF
jgi:hypothetical protein